MTSKSASAKEKSPLCSVGYERDGKFQAAERYVELERDEESCWKAVLHCGLDELPPIVVSARTDELALELLEIEADRCFDAFRANGGTTSGHIMGWGYEREVRPFREELKHWREERRLLHPEYFSQLRYEVLCAGVGYCLDHVAELQALGIDTERFQKMNW